MQASIERNQRRVDKIRDGGRNRPWNRIANHLNRKINYYLLLTLLMLLILLICVSDERSSQYRDFDHNQLDLDHSVPELEVLDARGHPQKIILLWTKYYNSSDFYFGLGSRPFVDAGCPCHNCILTDDRALLRLSHSVIFHPGNLNASDMPKVRYAHQKWIFYTFTAPAHYVPLPKMIADQFNWTMTYWKGSDIVHRFPFGRLIKHKSRQQNSSKWIPSIKRKTKKVAWISSTCRTSVQREHFVRELSKYIDVDIYGECGSMHCGTTDECDAIIKRDYKFILALEHTLCSDFISERLFWTLNLDAIPIVYGKANYKEFAPHYSYIDANSFQSSKELADFLLMVGSNDNIYQSFFEWKKHLRVERFPTNGWCDLCEKIDNPLSAHKRSSYKDINDWWMGHATCDSSYHQRLIYPPLKFE